MKKYIAIIVAAFGLYSCGNQDIAPVNGPVVETQEHPGKALFMQQCASCHAVKLDLIGPALAGVQQRWADKQKLHAFIRNSEEVIKQDAYAKSVWEKYNKTLMTPFPNLTDEQIDAILGYVDSESVGAAK